MLSSMLNMFRVGDLRKRIVFTLLMILLYRVGAFMPAPGIDVEQVNCSAIGRTRGAFWLSSSFSPAGP